MPNGNPKGVAANLLWLARDKAGLSQRELARRAGVPQSTVARVESGRMQPTVPVLQRLVGAAGYDIRFPLEPHDDHDEVLAARAAANPERARQQAVAMEEWRGAAALPAPVLREPATQAKDVDEWRDSVAQAAAAEAAG